MQNHGEMILIKGGQLLPLGRAVLKQKRGRNRSKRTLMYALVAMAQKNAGYATEKELIITVSQEKQKIVQCAREIRVLVRLVTEPE